MSKFYFTLWAKWGLRLTLCSIFLATVLSIFITLLIYINQGVPALNSEVFVALETIFKFWFPIAWSITILLALFRSLKYIFNSCNSHYELKLLSCQQELIENIGYGDLLKVWRKWFMLLIWLIVAEMIIALAFTYIFSSYTSIFGWFDIYILYLFILIAGYFSFIVLSSKCKKIKVVKC